MCAPSLIKLKPLGGITVGTSGDLLDFVRLEPMWRDVALEPVSVVQPQCRPALSTLGQLPKTLNNFLE
jgi:hypothetical protein